MDETRAGPSITTSDALVEERDLPTGVEYRGKRLWIRFSVGGKPFHEPCPKTVTSPRAASKYRNERIAEQTGGNGGSGRGKVQTALEAVLARYARDGRRSLDSARGRAKAVAAALGHVRIVDLTPRMIDRVTAGWRAGGLTPASCNRRLKILIRGLNLLVEAREIAFAPHVPLLVEDSPPGRYLTPENLEAIVENLPDHLHGLVRVAYQYGVRKRQLACTLRRYVDMDAQVIAWPASETKTGAPHVVPLDEDALAIIEAGMEAARPHCLYLWHAPDCKPGRSPNKRFGCIGDFKKSFRSAVVAAGLPYGRKGGIIFHSTRNSAASNLVRAGVGEAVAMKLTGHITAHVFRRYAVEDAAAVESRRAALEQRAAYLKSLSTTRKVVPLRPRKAAATTAGATKG